MFELVFAPLRRVFVLFLLMVHGVMLFFLMQSISKSEARAAIMAVLDLPDPVFMQSQMPVAKKPRIPFIVFNPTPSNQLVLPAGQPLRLQANQPAEWLVDQKFAGEGKTIFWPLTTPGPHVIQARHEGEEHNILIKVQ